jgi:glycosyltransferase involved in cell wall biosynthesis
MGMRGIVYEIPENGVDLTVWLSPDSPVAVEVPARFVFVGRLVEWKRLDFVLAALASCPGAVLDVVGDGPMRSDWSERADNMALGNRVRWLGWLPQRDCARLMQGATALLLPSIYECGGAVVLEAMACGLPVIATAWGGPVDYLDESCGILIEPTSAEAIVRGFAEAMQGLSRNPSRAAQLGERGRVRAQSLFDWNGKIERMLQLYAETIAQSQARGL